MQKVQEPIASFSPRVASRKVDTKDNEDHEKINGDETWCLNYSLDFGSLENGGHNYYYFALVFPQLTYVYICILIYNLSVLGNLHLVRV